MSEGLTPLLAVLVMFTMAVLLWLRRDEEE